MNAYELADEVEMWGNDLLALNMKGGIPITEGAKLIRQQANRILDLEMASDAGNIADLLQHQADFIALLQQALESSIKLNKAQATRGMKELTDEYIEHFVKKWFNCHPDAKLDEQITTPLYSAVNLCKVILKKASEK